MRKLVVRLIVLFHLLLAVGFVMQCRTDRRPDVILVSIDSLRPDHLGCYGYPRPTSPTIDALAREGTRFNQAISTTSWTLPAHAALFTGLYDSAHGLVNIGYRLHEAHVTLAERLRDAGYRTAGFYAGPFLHPSYGFDQGFERYVNCMSMPEQADVFDREEIRQLTDLSHADITGPRTLEKFTAWLESADRRPIFAFIHLWDVHYDYIPPERYVDMFDADYAGSVTAENYMSNDAVHAKMSRRDLEHVIALYDGEIRFSDDILGQILERIRGRDENAIIIVTADHGEEFFEHGGKGHLRTLHDEVVRIPLIVRWPGHVDAGRVVDDQVRLIDVMPTVLSLVGLPVNEDVQGRDITPLLRGKTMPEASALSEMLKDRRHYHRALRTHAYKALAIKREGVDIEAFFDLRADPGEHDVITERNPQFDAAIEEMDAIAQANYALHDRIAGPPDPTHMLDDDVKRRLRSLGYIGGDSGREQE